MGVAGTVAGMASAAAGFAVSATATASLLADATLGSMERVQWVATATSTPPRWRSFTSGVDQVVETWEHRTAADLLPQVLRHRHWVDRLLRGHQHPDQQRELYLVASRLAGLLAYLSFDSRRLRLRQDALCGGAGLRRALRPRAHGSVGPRHAGDDLPVLRPGTGSRSSTPGTGCAAPSDPVQAARLACFGEAAGAGRLGDRSVVQAAVGRARTAMDRQGPAPSTTAGQSRRRRPGRAGGPRRALDVSFTSFSRAQLALYTGTALVVSGDAENARGHSAERGHDVHTGRLSRTVVAGPGSTSRRARARARPDPERAAATVRAALAATAERPTTPLAAEAAEFFAIAAPYGRLQCCGRGRALPGAGATGCSPRPG